MAIYKALERGVHLPFQRRREEFAALVQHTHTLHPVFRRRLADAAQLPNILRAAHPASPQHARRGQKPRRKNVGRVLHRIVRRRRLPVDQIAPPDVSQDDMPDFVRDRKPQPLRRPRTVDPDVRRAPDDRTHAVARIVRRQHPDMYPQLPTHRRHTHWQRIHAAVQQDFPRAVPRLLIIFVIHN